MMVLCLLPGKIFSRVLSKFKNTVLEINLSSKATVFRGFRQFMSGERTLEGHEPVVVEWQRHLPQKMPLG